MINFWSYKDEYKRYKSSLVNIFDNTLKNGQIFFGKNLSSFENNFKKKYKYNLDRYEIKNIVKLYEEVL